MLPDAFYKGLSQIQFEQITRNISSAKSSRDERRQKFWEQAKTVGLPLLQSVLGGFAAANFAGFGSNNSDNQISESQLQKFENQTRSKNDLNPLGLSNSTVILVVAVVFLYLYFQKK